MSEQDKPSGAFEAVGGNESRQAERSVTAMRVDRVLAGRGIWCMCVPFGIGKTLCLQYCDEIGRSLTIDQGTVLEADRRRLVTRENGVGTRRIGAQLHGRVTCGFGNRGHDARRGPRAAKYKGRLKRVNPLTGRNQMAGAVVMGIGMERFETTEYDSRSGISTKNNYAEYPIPMDANQPEIDVMLLDQPDLALNEFCALGIGEIGITGLAAAVANAVRHATGKRVRDLPITLDNLADNAHTLSV